MAGNAQSRKAALLCPRCRRLVSADEATCPHCGLASPASRWKQAFSAGLMVDGDRMIHIIVGANIALYLLSLLISRQGWQLSLNPLQALAPDYEGLIRLGATGTVPIDRFGHWWSLIAATYLHGGILHIAFNILALRQIAPFVIREFGPSRMLVIYTLGGSGGFLISYLAGVQLTIGASAAVCGLIGAALYYGKSRAGAYGQAVYRQVGGWVVGIALFGLIIPGINNWAHGGGLLTGVLLGALMGYQERVRENPLHRLLGWLCLAATAAVLLWAVATGLVAWS
mgnify:CR=1 FL=1